MNKFIKLAAMVTMAVVALPSCSDNDKNDIPDVPQSAKEAALSKATSEYVSNTVLPTYKAMADAAI